MAKWSTFAVVAGGAAAGVTGLLFVAVSIRIDVIAKSQELRNRAAQTLALFVTECPKCGHGRAGTRRDVPGPKTSQGVD